MIHHRYIIHRCMIESDRDTGNHYVTSEGGEGTTVGSFLTLPEAIQAAKKHNNGIVDEEITEKVEDNA